MRIISNISREPGANRLRVPHRGVLAVAEDFHWSLEAWVVFWNYYQSMAHSPVHESDVSYEPKSGRARV